MNKTRGEAWALLNQHTQTPGLIKHALAVESAMRWYATHFGQTEAEVEKWGITGLLHDFPDVVVGTPKSRLILSIGHRKIPWPALFALAK